MLGLTTEDRAGPWQDAVTVLECDPGAIPVSLLHITLGLESEGHLHEELASFLFSSLAVLFFF